MADKHHRHDRGHQRVEPEGADPTRIYYSTPRPTGPHGRQQRHNHPHEAAAANGGRAEKPRPARPHTGSKGGRPYQEHGSARPIRANTSPYLRPAWDAEAQRRKRKTDLTPLIMVITLLVIIGGGALFFWLHRPVSFTLNGSSYQMPYGSTLASIRDEDASDVTPGNLVSVNGNVITQGGGQPFVATVGGQTLSDDDAKHFRLKGGEDIGLSNGGDVTEDYDVTSQQDVAPKLKMEGSEGTIFYVSQWGKAGKSETRVGKTSGETCEAVIQQPTDCVVTRQYIKPANDEKLVALTFDDGPSKYTDQYLDILEKCGIKATFNMCGNQLADFSAEAKRVADDGDEIASHTWDHKQLTTLNAEQVRQELDDSFKAIKDATGVDTTFLRQPYGSINANVWLYSGGSMTMAAYWTQDSEDWRLPGADAIVQHATANMKPGSIILMHDGGGERDQDVEALPRIIQAWQAAGYRFVTMSDLMASDPSIPSEACSSTRKMPDDAVWPTELSSDSINNAIP